MDQALRFLRQLPPGSQVKLMVLGVSDVCEQVCAAPSEQRQLQLRTALLWTARGVGQVPAGAYSGLDWSFGFRGFRREDRHGHHRGGQAQ